MHRWKRSHFTCTAFRVLHCNYSTSPLLPLKAILSSVWGYVIHLKVHLYVLFIWKCRSSILLLTFTDASSMIFLQKCWCCTPPPCLIDNTLSLHLEMGRLTYCVAVKSIHPSFCGWNVFVSDFMPLLTPELNYQEPFWVTLWVILNN